MAAPGSEPVRILFQEIYLQDLALGLYGVYLDRLRDAAGRALLETYVRAEEDRRRRIERHLQARGLAAPAGARRLFAAAGRAYGRITSLLGSRGMLRIVLSSSRRAARRSCAAIGGAGRPDLIFLDTLRARSVDALVDGLRQHLIDTRPPR